MAEQVRLGIIGLGAQVRRTPRIYSATAWCQTWRLAPSARCGIRRRPRLLSRVTPVSGSTTTTSTMLDSGDVDAVVICARTTCTRKWASRRSSAEHPRPRGEASRRVHQASARAQRVRRDQTGPDLRNHVQPAQQPALQKLKEIVDGVRQSATPTGSSPPGGDRRVTTDSVRGAPPGVARGRRAGQPGTTPAGPVAVDLWHAEVRLRQGCLRLPPRHRGGG